MENRPILVWFRRDFRLADNAALTEAVKTGRPVIPVFILDPLVETMGAAPKWRLAEAIQRFSATLTDMGSKLILRKGAALDVLTELLSETGADTVYWERQYEPKSVARDTEIKSTLTCYGHKVESFGGFLLFEPWTVETRQGNPYSVYTPFWRAVRDREVRAPFAPPRALPRPGAWPRSDDLGQWQMGAAMFRGASVAANHAGIGEEVALRRLHDFCDRLIDSYKDDRNRPDIAATSRLSENLTYGEISPRTVWWAGRAAVETGADGAEHFLKELVWREFAWHLHWHSPTLPTDNWREKWNAFPWRQDNDLAEAWRRGETGVELVDAGMREMYATGTMHNRVRMIVASYLTKHLLTDWRVGRAWFEDTLIDWDPASNAMGWQWVAGCGPDAAPYFRIFNPDTQAETFDASRSYRSLYLDQGMKGARDFLNAIPKSWNVKRPSSPIVALKDGRARALAAYEVVKG